VNAPRGARSAAAAFGVAAFFSDVAHESVAALLPSFLALLGGTPRSLGVVEGVADAGAAFCKILGGRLADRRRALKPATAAGYFVSALALPVIGFATSWIHVALLRGASHSGRGFRSPLRDQMLTRAVPPASRGAAFGVERAMDQAGGLVASIAIALALSANAEIRPLLMASLVPGALAMAAIIFLAPEHPEPVRVAKEDGDGSRRGVRRLLASVAVFGVGDFAVTLALLWAVGEERAKEAAGAAQIAGLYGVYKAAAGAAALFGGRLSDAFGRKSTYLAGHAVGLLAALVPALCRPGLAAGVAAAVGSGVLYGVQEAVQKAWIADLAPHGRRGRAFGYLHALRGATSLAASLLLAELWSAFGAPFAFGTAAVLMTAGLCVAATAPATARSASA
jgi:MFS family permease